MTAPLGSKSSSGGFLLCVTLLKRLHTAGTIYEWEAYCWISNRVTWNLVFLGSRDFHVSNGEDDWGNTLLIFRFMTLAAAVIRWCTNDVTKVIHIPHIPFGWLSYWQRVLSHCCIGTIDLQVLIFPIHLFQCWGNSENSVTAYPKNSRGFVFSVLPIQ